MTDLSSISTDIMMLNLDIDRNAREQRKQLDRLSKIHSQIEEGIEEQLQELTNLVAQKADVEVRENLARELIFHINKTVESLNKYQDRYFVANEAQTLLSLIQKYSLNTRTFSQIQDKEYFTNVLESLKEAAASISASEQREITEFIKCYADAYKIIEDCKSIGKIINVPADFCCGTKPEQPTILSNERIVGLFKEPEKLKREENINSLKKLKIELPSFCTAKKEYEIAYETWRFKNSVIENQKNTEELSSRLSEYKKPIESFLSAHPVFLTSYPATNFTEIFNTTDFNKLKQELENHISNIENQIDDFLKEMLKHIDNEKLRIAKNNRIGFILFIGFIVLGCILQAIL